jgi:hypothetical protein
MQHSKKEKMHHHEMANRIEILKYGKRLATGRYFSPGTPVSSTDTTNRHDIPEILLKVALNTMAKKILDL